MCLPMCICMCICVDFPMYLWMCTGGSPCLCTPASPYVFWLCACTCLPMCLGLCKCVFPYVFTVNGRPNFLELLVTQAKVSNSTRSRWDSLSPSLSYYPLTVKGCPSCNIYPSVYACVCQPVSLYVHVCISLCVSVSMCRSPRMCIRLSVKIAEKHNPNRWIYYDVKSTLNVSVSVTIIRTWISE